MAVTLGFVMRIDSFPPAVAVPPPVAPAQSRTAVIDVEAVNGPTAAAASSSLRNHQAASMSYRESRQQPPLTYTQHGVGVRPAFAADSHLVDLYA